MSSPVPIINVRNIISIFENQTTEKDPAPSSIKRTKSLNNLDKPIELQKNHQLPVVEIKKTVSTPSLASPELFKVEQNLTELQFELEQYESYSKERHIHYQNELLTFLGDIVTVDSSEESIINKKKELIEMIKNLNRLLNSQLPIASIKKDDIKHLTTTPIAANKPTIEDFPDRSEEDIPSVRRLRSLFEKKSAESDRGLVALVQDKKPKRYLTFSGKSSDFRYIPYDQSQLEARNGLNKALGESDKKYIVDGDFFHTNRIVHNASIQRSKSLNTPPNIIHIERRSSKVEDLKSLFENPDLLARQREMRDEEDEVAVREDQEISAGDYSDGEDSLMDGQKDYSNHDTINSDDFREDHELSSDVSSADISITDE